MLFRKHYSASIQKCHLHIHFHHIILRILYNWKKNSIFTYQSIKNIHHEKSKKQHEKIKKTGIKNN